MKIVTRKTCLICSTPLINHGNKRQRVYCSKICCTKAHNLKRADTSAEYQRQRRAIKARIPDEKKKKCAICGLWFVQVGSHIVQIHGMTARQYREYFDLPIKKGITALPYRKIKGDAVFKNGTVKNLKKGKKNWYSKNDKRAKVSHVGWKGRKGAIGYVPTDFYG